MKNWEEATKPGGPQFVISGTAEGATGNDVAVLLRETIGLNVKIVTGYPDSGVMFLAVDRKEVDGRFVGLSAVSAAKSDWLKPDSNMRVILQFGRLERNKLFPDAPTLIEQGTNVELSWLSGVYAPAGTPRTIIDRLQREIAATLSDPMTIEKLVAQGQTPVGSTPEELSKVLVRETPIWAELIRQSGARVE